MRGFADAFRSYDLAARRFPIYASVDPFVELELGIALLSGFVPTVTYSVTLLVMAAKLVGVAQALISEQRGDRPFRVLFAYDGSVCCEAALAAACRLTLLRNTQTNAVTRPSRPCRRKSQNGWLRPGAAPKPRR